MYVTICIAGQLDHDSSPDHKSKMLNTLSQSFNKLQPSKCEYLHTKYSPQNVSVLHTKYSPQNVSIYTQTTALKM